MDTDQQIDNEDVVTQYNNVLVWLNEMHHMEYAKIIARIEQDKVLGNFRNKKHENPFYIKGRWT